MNTNMTQYETIVGECESLIRMGSIAQSAKILSGVNLAQVPREWRLPLAKLCRRSGLIAKGLKILTPLIRAEQDKLQIKPTDQELAEYAVLLQINGSVREAISILETVDLTAAPEGLLYRSFCHFNQWEYRAAIPKLENYLRSALDPYLRLVGQVNLAAALAMAKLHDDALKILDVSIQQCTQENYFRLEANCYELKSQVHIQNNDFVKAREELKKASEILSAGNVPDTLFIQKWKTVIQAFETRSVAPFAKLREDAKTRRVWETFREVDLLELKTIYNFDQHKNLIFGTPYPAYRQRVEDEIGKKDWPIVTLIGSPFNPWFDIQTGEFAGREIFKPGCKNHQTLEILMRDYYKPLSVGGLFSELFPGEYFNIFSAPDRVHQTISRTRSWLKKSKLPMEVVENEGWYSLKWDASKISVKVPFQRRPISWFEVFLQKLIEANPSGKKLSASGICQILGFTTAEYKRFLKWALENHRLNRVYDGSLPLYEIPQQEKVREAA